MSNLFNTMMNLINTNNGEFKSQKQKAFLFSQSVDGLLPISGGTFNKSWVDFFELDEKGVVEWIRENKKSRSEKWNREGTAEEQIKNKKRADKHNAKLEKHHAMWIDAENYYNELCVEKFGFIIDKSKFNDLYSMLQKMENILIIMDSIKSMNSDEMNDFALHWPLFKENLEHCKKLNHVWSVELMNIRIKVKEKYESDFSFDFL